MEEKKKILFVVTNHSKLGDTGKETGFYLSEVSHPWKILHDAGYEVDFVSPTGGKAPVDALDLDDSVNKEFWENEKYRNKIDNTLKPEEVKLEEYIAIHYAGGHGTMWDFPESYELAEIARHIYEENNGYITAVCHGPSGLLNIRLNDGGYLVEAKKVNSFTNEEEVEVGLDKVVPFLLESKLEERGAKFEKSDKFKEHVTVDERLITGQNPASAKAVGEELLKQLNNN